MKKCNKIQCNDKYYGKGLCHRHYNSLPRVIEYQKQYKLKNKEKIKKYEKEYREKHPEVLLKAVRKHFEKMGNKLGITSMEYSYAIKSWSKTVRNLDNKTCKLCDSTTNLHAHHIQPKSLFPELCLDLDNGVTLCNKCHTNVHGFETY